MLYAYCVCHIRIRARHSDGVNRFIHRAHTGHVIGGAPEAPNALHLRPFHPELRLHVHHGHI
jgi:hypothetical protein